jgi:hypothetical protein
MHPCHWRDKLCGDFSGDLAPDCSVKTLLLDPLLLSGIPGLPVSVPGNT